MNQNHFHSLSFAQDENDLRKRLKPVEVGPSDLKFLRVPGLKTIRSAYISGVEIPLSITETYPHSEPAKANAGQTETMGIPLLKLDADSDGCPILLRGLKSNYGIWQANETVWIDGDWEDAPAPAPAKK